MMAPIITLLYTVGSTSHGDSDYHTDVLCSGQKYALDHIL